MVIMTVYLFQFCTSYGNNSHHVTYVLYLPVSAWRYCFENQKYVSVSMSMTTAYFIINASDISLCFCFLTSRVLFKITRKRLVETVMYVMSNYVNCSYHRED